MTAARLLLAALAVLLIGAHAAPVKHAKKLPDALVGKWQQVGSEETLEFFANGRLQTTTRDAQAGARYKLVGNRLEIDVGLSTRPIVWTVKIAGNALTLTDVDGQARKYRRVK